jgi:hypothetical protein
MSIIDSFLLNPQEFDRRPAWFGAGSCESVGQSETEGKGAGWLVGWKRQAAVTACDCRRGRSAEERSRRGQEGWMDGMAIYSGTDFLGMTACYIR